MPSKDTRSPSTEAVMFLVERLDAYLDGRDPALAEALFLAASWAIEDAGLGSFPLATVGWDRAFANDMKNIVTGVMGLRGQPDKSKILDGHLREDLGVLLRYVREMLWFNLGVEYTEAGANQAPGWWIEANQSDVIRFRGDHALNYTGYMGKLKAAGIIDCHRSNRQKFLVHFDNTADHERFREHMGRKPKPKRNRREL